MVERGPRVLWLAQTLGGAEEKEFIICIRWNRRDLKVRDLKVSISLFVFDGTVETLFVFEYEYKYK